MTTIPVPPIYSIRHKPARTPPVGRIGALAVSLISLSLLTTAALLKPDPSGMGTHTALGLPPCSMPRVFGIPCPTCGMTTSWSWFARGNLVASLWVQPMGTLLALATATFFWAGLYIAVTARPAQRLISYLPTGYIGFSLLTLALLAWVWKIYIQLHHLDGWQ